MRHHVDGRKLGRSPTHRKAMMANLVKSLVRYERVETTLARAKELRRDAEKIVTLGKRGTLHARRQAFATLRDDALTRKVFGDLADRFRERPGGYTRIVKTGRRHGDDAEMAMIEYLPADAELKPKAKKAKPKAKKKVEEPKDAIKEAVSKAATEAAEEAGEKAESKKSTKKASADADAEEKQAEAKADSDEPAAEAKDDAEGEDEKKS